MQGCVYYIEYPALANMNTSWHQQPRLQANEAGEEELVAHQTLVNQVCSHWSCLTRTYTSQEFRDGNDEVDPETGSQLHLQDFAPPSPSEHTKFFTSHLQSCVPPSPSRPVTSTDAVLISPWPDERPKLRSRPRLHEHGIAFDEADSLYVVPRGIYYRIRGFARFRTCTRSSLPEAMACRKVLRTRPLCIRRHC